MKKRILFVDDQQMILQGLQRMLRPMREDWDMAFVESGAQALARMAEAPFDVVVTDARMPGMTGPQLLTEVMRCHPATVRLVLSGHADQEIVARCIGVAHQYITKPCDPEQLKSLIQNACRMSSQLLSEEAKRLIGSIDRLPSVPEIYLELREAMEVEDASPQTLGDIIGKDVAMTALILKIVNSAFFGLRRAILTPQEAVTYLGADTIKLLVLTNHLFEKSAPFATAHLSIEDLWRHSMAVAAGARAITTLECQDRKLQDEAFVGGLLHDVGILVLAKNCPEAYDRAMALSAQEGVMLTTAEQEEFGVTHAEVGAYLLGLWGIPAPILKIVSLHHNPGLLEESAFSPLLAVHAAEAFVGKAGHLSPFENHRLDDRALLCAGLSDRIGPWETAVLASMTQS